MQGPGLGLRSIKSCVGTWTKSGYDVEISDLKHIGSLPNAKDDEVLLVDEWIVA